jgi:hypothetical protein
MAMQTTVIHMLLKAAGIDPEFLQRKALEFEVLAKALGQELQSKVASIDSRLEELKLHLELVEAQQAQMLTMLAAPTVHLSASAGMPLANGHWEAGGAFVPLPERE